MLKDRLNTNIAGKFLSREKIYQSMNEFLEFHIPGFILYLKNVDFTLTKENDLTQQLYFYLDSKTRVKSKTIIPFRFGNQFAYPNSAYSSDIGVIVEMFSRRDAFFVIEAKRLPTPGSGRKREYVVGKQGGIERFKRELHGKGLPKSAIVAYVMKQEFSYWFTEINSWIQEVINTNKDDSIIWTEKDRLIVMSNSNNVLKCLSKHHRMSEVEIELRHYWINLQ